MRSLKLLIVLFFAMESVVGCSITQNEPKKMTARDADAIPVVHQYVARRKGWRASDYRIERNRRESGCVVYTVVCLADERRSVPGGGESFEVFYDPAKHRVVKELGFQ